MAFNIWGRETRRGTGLSMSERTKAINFKLAAEVDQLWIALCMHHERRKNDLAAWAIKLLAEHEEVKDGKRPHDMGVGLKHPKQKFPACNKYTKAEKDLWQSLKGAYRGGWAGVLTVALIELYWRKPVDLSIANLPSAKKVT